MAEEMIYNTENNPPPKHNIPEKSYFYLGNNLLFQRINGVWINTNEDACD